MTKKTCCFTGHQTKNLIFAFDENDERCVRLKAELKTVIIKMIEQYGVTEFITGMAIGVDMYAAQLVSELKKQYPQIKLECALPFENQAEKWSEPLRDSYFAVMEHCDRETLLQTSYTDGCMKRRNEYMLRKSDYVIAVGYDSITGTVNTASFALSESKDEHLRSDCGNFSVSCR